MNALLWPLLRRWVRLRRGRLPPRSVADPVWYFAYGSNMNERLFRERRHMTPLETRLGRLDGYRLCFTVAGGRRPGTSAPANIVVAPGSTVYGVLYLLSLRKFARLDASEGQQYAYLWTEAIDAHGTTIPAVTFRVLDISVEGSPSLAYLNIIRDAARQRDLPAEYVSFFDEIKPRT